MAIRACPSSRTHGDAGSLLPDQEIRCGFSRPVSHRGFRSRWAIALPPADLSGVELYCAIVLFPGNRCCCFAAVAPACCWFCSSCGCCRASGSSAFSGLWTSSRGDSGGPVCLRVDHVATLLARDRSPCPRHPVVFSSVAAVSRNLPATLPAHRARYCSTE